MREDHTADTLKRLLTQFPGRGVVWAHNTHVGDATATDMGAVRLVSRGQLARQMLGERDTLLIGMGSQAGTVIAASAWGSPSQIMAAPRARLGSHEAGNYVPTVMGRRYDAFLWFTQPRLCDLSPRLPRLPGHE